MTKQRRWTKQIIKHLEANGFHPVDVQYGDSYFIIERGKDMVVHFHVKELKGWKFGIWWDVDGEKTFNFFTQYERDIDKFKPSASALVQEDVALEDWKLKDLVEMCRFIKKHPYRAWALDQSYTHEIWEWGTLNGCFKEYWQGWWNDSVSWPRVHKKMTKRYLKLVKEIADTFLINPEIIDENTNGWEAYPRFHILCDGVKGEKLRKGKHYDIDLENELNGRLLKKVKRYNKKSDKNDLKYTALSDVHLGYSLPFTVREGKVMETIRKK